MTHRYTLFFQPWDTCVFRDARPFYQDDEGLAEAYSLFPPTQRTIVGAARALLANRLGWKGGPWSEKIKERLGDGDDLGPLKFSAALVGRREGAEPLRLYCRLPANLAADHWYHDRFLVAGHPDGAQALISWKPAPDTPVVASDGGASLPVPPRYNGMYCNSVPLDDHYLDLEKLLGGADNSSVLAVNMADQDLLRGEVTPAMLDEGRPRYQRISERKTAEREAWENCHPRALRTLALRGAGAIYLRETRTGIARETATRQAIDGMLYQTSLIRLLPGYGFAIGLETPTPFKDLTRDGPFNLPLGGEGRNATVHVFEDVPSLWDSGRWPASSNETIATVTLTSPALVRPGRLQAGARLWDDGPAIVSMAAPSPETTGGWWSHPVGQSALGAGEGLVQIPAGSVFFVKLSDKVAAPSAIGDWGAAWGYGRYVVAGR